MKLSLQTLIRFRALAIELQRIIESALLEAYGWTPRHSTPDIDAVCYTEQKRA